MTEKIIIRKANEKDITAVRAIANVPGLQVAGEERAPGEKWFKAFIKEKQMFFVAEIKKEVVGFIIGERTTGNIGYLWEMGVRLDLRSKGIGSLLLKKFIDGCEKRKLRFAIAYGHANKKTINFFKKHKFIEGDNYKEIRRDLKDF